MDKFLLEEVSKTLTVTGSKFTLKGSIKMQKNVSIRFAAYPPVNSGALHGLRRKGNTLYLPVLQPSASSHASPGYPLSAEAPRIYGTETSEAKFRRAWVFWAASFFETYPRIDDGGPKDEVHARLVLAENLDKIPEI